MTRWRGPLLLGALLLGPATPGSDLVRHRLTVSIDPASRELRVTDRIQLPADLAREGLEFLLNGALQPSSSDPPIQAVPLGEAEEFFGINGSSVKLSDSVRLARYRLAAPPADGVLELTYAGSFDFGLSEQKEEYTRGFRETAGIVGANGLYLAGGGFWVPYFDDRLVSFELDAGVPEGWHLISQGRGVSRDDRGAAHWDSAGPVDEIYLVGGPLLLYREAAGSVEAQVYLREPDEALARKYLEATARYLEMYRQLVGPYPYDKFALVENFWETGYGMPSFTLLGPRVLRFPWILHSSYPHEILHNWWGNGVFVDYATGNWCEGLTAYLADHLIQEQRGKGSDYRRAALQKYRNYVREGRDFPLAEFRSRHSAATEAVGYGKSLMTFHMLRRTVGDEAFRRALRAFYRTERGKRASFGDLQRSVEETTDGDWSWFFDQWVGRTGAPDLALRNLQVARAEPQWILRGRIVQTQAEAAYRLDVPVAVSTESGVRRISVSMQDKEQAFEVRSDAPPVRIDVDPDFDLFRLLDPREIPPSIGQIFGEPAILAMLPPNLSGERREAVERTLEAWRSDEHEIEIVDAAAIDELPPDQSAWIVGRENPHAVRWFERDGPDGVEMGETALELAGQRVPFADHSVVAVRRHPHNDERVVGWLWVEPQAAWEGLARKLPHYGKYSYLAFAGTEPTNVVKGQWEATGSRLTGDLRPEKGRATPLAAVPGDPRSALAELPPIISERALARHIEVLSSPALEGRGIGSSGLREAADYVAREFEAAGLRPGGPAGAFLQPFHISEGPEGGPHELANVVGYLPASRPEAEAGSVIVCAHYDHLGRGWPDVHAGDEGRIHPGADDNASGVAVLIELAKSLAAGGARQRHVVFIAFSAEEAGRLGSKHFVDHPAPWTLDRLLGVINLDTVGRLFDQRLTVLGTGTADEWPHVFRGVGFVTGIESRNVPESLESSDQLSFIEKGIPAVQLFTQPHTDYHRPTDTAEKLDLPGLVKVATFVAETVTYMADRREPFRVTIAPAEGAQETAAGGPTAAAARKVRLGTIPEFGFPGPGAQIGSVIDDSPAARAGLLPGDVILRLDECEIAGLRELSACLKTLESGQTVEVTVRRGDRTLTLPVRVEAR